MTITDFPTTASGVRDAVPDPLSPRPSAPGDRALAAARSRLAEASRFLGLDDNLHRMLATPRRSLAVSVPVRREDGHMEVVEGCRVQHNLLRGPATGGVRFHPSADLAGVTALAMGTTWACALAGVPYGGAAGGVAVDPRELTPRELERLTRRYANEILPLMGPEKDVPVPDAGTDERTVAWIMDTCGGDAGHPIPGTATGRAGATARGLEIVALRALDRAPEGVTVAVQGFGAVGALTARHLADAGCRVVAVSDAAGAVVRPSGLDVAALRAHTAEAGSVRGFAGADALGRDELLGLDVDVLVPAALDGAITAAEASRVRARLVVEGADGAATPEADLVLADAGTTVVPGILANAGGVIASYLEPAQDAQARSWSAGEAGARLRDRMEDAYRAVRALADDEGLTLRRAAHAIGVRRVAEAHRLRGLHP
ncbi:Glu/Leu/Phe/Val dehydrogenase [Microbispora corallina]|uniref:Glutamate dehydrogenase n=1 Tax=Microbispora corallina TaxID=83302 RepID=A0ABQ4FS73_9ACTN|nr:Glu/Leu/Phe/Val dehydrogenase [Microbispora corallina]GIH37592.1 glutamate dehydrogenase [Microbispora corallina]